MMNQTTLFVFLNPIQHNDSFGNSFNYFNNYLKT